MNGLFHSPDRKPYSFLQKEQPPFSYAHSLRVLTFCISMLAASTALQAQDINLTAKKEALEQVIKKLRAQTDYVIMAPSSTLSKTRPVSINLKGVSIDQAMREIFKNQPPTLDYEIKGKNIIIRERVPLEPGGRPKEQQPAKKTGRVLTQAGYPLAGATITALQTGNATSSTETGSFEIAIQDNEHLSIKMLGYESQDITVRGSIGDIRLAPTNIVMETAEVINTGYQSIPKERATGSFSTISRELLNQQVSTDILSRIPNVANSVMMDQSGYSGQIMVRGLSTISGPKNPLIVVDNFPYEGELNNINPNIVENVTILKDASASSIWGARAANGVIVITTKKGLFNHPFNIDFNSSLTVSGKPDLDYIRQMSSSDFIDVEQELFKIGFYNSKINSKNKPLLSPVVDYLNKAAKGIITPEEANNAINNLHTVDVRDQFDQYMYKPAVKQQYYLSAQGGSEKFSWLSAVGYDHNRENLGENYNRINIRFQNTYRPVQNLSVSTNLYYTQTGNNSGRTGYKSIATLFPYTRMADDQGNPLPVGRNWNQTYIQTAGDGKLLDWNYYPLTDWKHQKTNVTASNILTSIGLKYEITEGLAASLDYQYERESGLSTALADENSYMARDYINRFTQIVNGVPVYIIPKGGILDKTNRINNVHNLRGQLGYDKTFGAHNVNVIIGAEMRTNKNEGNSAKYYGYDSNNLTTGNVDYTKTYPNFITGANSTITNGNTLTQTDRRFVSQFANAAYTLNNKYILSASLRRDGSNLFGLKTNDQWNPFWSAGLSWKFSKEAFYHSELLPYINLRATYGYSGNINPAMVAVNTMRFLPSPSLYTGTRTALFNNYYNPELRWETSKMFNLGVDFQSKNNRLSGTLEYYHKKGVNLFGTSQIDYTTGVPTSILRNVASMKGTGMDIMIKSLNINHTFKWNTIFNFSVYKDQIVAYNVNRTLASSYISTNTPPVSGVAGHPVYTIYAYKWGGLDPETGAPTGYLNDQISKDYTSIVGEGNKVEGLQYFGSAIPTRFGSMVNSFAYKNISLQVGISYKFGYWFRRNSINYTELFNNWRGHSDYALRWKTPGDELLTNIPSIDYKTNSSRDQFYDGSSVLVEKGDHIRLQYINLAYTFNNIRNIRSFQLFLNASNLGLIWKANKSGIDPDFNINLSGFVTPANYNLGIRAQF